MSKIELLDIWAITGTSPQIEVFCIKTKEYSGNFERRLCAFLTGQIGECEVGDKEAKEHNNLFNDEDLFLDSIALLPDEHGCYRPVSAGKVNDDWGVFIFFEYLDEKMINTLKSRLTLAENKFNIHILDTICFSIINKQEIKEYE